MGDSTVPAEVVEQLKRFNEALTALEDSYQAHFSNSDVNSIQRSPLEKVEIDLMSVFVINSLYWMLLCTQGRKPKENEMLQNEIKRTKEYMGRLKELEQRTSAPRLNQRAARSFVRNALWEAHEGLGEVMEGRDGASSAKEGEIDGDQMEEGKGALADVKTAPKRSPKETNLMMAGCALPKKKRI